MELMLGEIKIILNETIIDKSISYSLEIVLKEHSRILVASEHEV